MYLESIFDELWPLCRSVAGPALRKSISILSNYQPYDLLEIPSGTYFSDWQVPNEWELLSASLTTVDGHIIASTDFSNLSVLNYSIPFESTLTYDELLPNLHYDIDRPNVIPYKTSYYKSRWGICLPHTVFSSLDKELLYKVSINTRIYPGSMTLGELYLPGDSTEEILLTSYLCHPSMANNELSGPLCLLHLYNLLLLRKRRFSYRFVIGPETIGSIAYISRSFESLSQNLYGGFCLAMVGRNTPLTLRKPCLDSLFSRSLVNLLELYPYSIQLKEWSPFGGGDQRQYTARGNRFPMSYITRSPNGRFPEYHSSSDDKSMLCFDSIINTAIVLDDLLGLVEKDMVFKSISERCETQLGNKGLYPSIGGLRGSLSLKSLISVLGYSDGTCLLSDISLRERLPFKSTVDAANSLVAQQLLSNSASG